MAELIVYLRSREIDRVPITLAQTTIGRDGGCDVVIDNPGVSRTHAILTYQDGAFRIADTGSENGITVNGRPTKAGELNFGDVVGINKYRVQFSPDGGVPPELLAAPIQQGGDGARNIVATMTINADAAKQMQEDLLRKKRAQEMIERKTADVPAVGSNVPWTFLLLVLLALMGMGVYRFLLG